MIKLRELRENRGISVKDMCRKLGVDDSRYRKWESGINGLPLEFLLRAVIFSTARWTIWQEGQPSLSTTWVSCPHKRSSW